MNLKTKVDVWLGIPRFFDQKMKEDSFRNLLSDIFDEIERRADKVADAHESEYPHARVLSEIRAELNISRKP